PGLDCSMSDEDLLLVTHDPLSGEPSREASNRSHPQYGLSRLLQRQGIERSMGVPHDTPGAALAARAELLSRALLPVHATAGWEQQRHAMQDDQALGAFDGACLVEAANEREEATAIAIALRLALEESEESQAALITPD